MLTGKCGLYNLLSTLYLSFFYENFRATGHDEMCNFYIMYYSDANLLKYSGGDCGEQNHPEIFKHFPSDSDTPLVHPLSSKATETPNQAANPTNNTAAVQTTHSSVVTPEEQSTQTTVGVEMSTHSTSHETIHEIDISELEYGEEESPKSSSSSNQDKKPLAGENPMPTEIVSQGVSKKLVSPTNESQPVIPAVTVTSEPVRPVVPSSDTEEHTSKLRVVSDWPSLTAAENSKLGQVSGVSLDSKGRVVVFHRASRTWDAKYVTPIKLPVIWIYICS